MSDGAPEPALPAAAPTAPQELVASSALPVGWRIHEFVIEGLVGEGGFGIVYLARDTQLQRTVAIKEYMPAQLAQRLSDHSVQVRSQRHADTFALGLRSFVNEARMLALFDHPSLVKVYRFWEGNGTAYMVMPYYQGPTLKSWLLEHRHAPSEEWLKRLLRPMLDALELIHRDHCYHRDIAPDNILLLQGDRPLLLDFGAARRVIGDATQALTVILKPGYAPIEQYAEMESMKQGPWTDVYAMCAVLYASMTITAPHPSVARMVKDDMVPASVAAAGRYSDSFLRAIDAGLAVRPEQRPQNIAELRRLLFPEQFVHSGPAPLDEVTGAYRELDPDSTLAPLPRVDAAATGLTSAKPAMVAAPAPPAGVAAPPVQLARRASDRDPTAERRPVSRNTSPARWQAVAALAVVGLMFVGGAWLMRSPETPSAAEPQPPGATPPAVVPVPSISTPVSPASAAPQRAAFSVVGALQDMVLQADPLFAVNTLPDQSPITIGKDRLQFRVKASRTGYLYVFLAGTDAAHFYLLFPNKIDKNNRVEADRVIVLPRAGWHITAGGPPGTNHIVTVVSAHPLDLSQTGLREDGDIAEFDLNLAAQRWAAHSGAGSPFLGTPHCEAPPCELNYGAALVKIDEVAR